MAGPEPSVAEADTQFKNGCHLLEEVLKAGSENAENFLDLSDTYLQSIESDYADEAMAGVRAMRGNLNAAISDPRIVLDPIMKMYGRAIDAPSDDPEEIATVWIPRYWRANSKTLKERNFTNGTPTADGGNTGDGTIGALRLNQYAEPLENRYAESLEARCIFDATNGAPAQPRGFPGRGRPQAPGRATADGLGARGVVDLRGCG